MNNLAKDLKRVVAAIEKHKAALGKHRDELRDLIDELECLDSDVDYAIAGLESATESLSRLV